MSKEIQFNGNPAIHHDGKTKNTPQRIKPVYLKGLRICLICFLVLIYPLYRILPLWMAWENNILENTQAVILLAGFLVALYFAFLTRDTVETKFWRAIAPFWLLALGRELSWGRVFLMPIKFTSHGPVFPPMDTIPYHPAIYLVVFLCLVFGLYSFFKNRCYRILLQSVRQKRFPILEFAIIIVAAILSTLAEKDHFHLLGVHNEAMEELLELLSYMGLFLTQLNFYSQAKPEPN